MADQIILSGAFDDLRLNDFRFLEEASKRGRLRVKLWSDDAIMAATGTAPKFPVAERKYLLEAIRFVDRVDVIDDPNRDDSLPSPGRQPQVFSPLPDPDPVPIDPPGKKVLVTGCYDYFHSGHVAFFEECAAMGDLYVGVGSDATIEQLKGKGHPLFPQDQRRYIVSACRHVKHAFISTGTGWLDAEPELEKIRPQIYAVNEDGDKPAKRAYCESHGIEYRVLKRVPKKGLPARQSTALRGF
jgi:cytidyltransferase-like protein